VVVAYADDVEIEVTSQEDITAIIGGTRCYE
jgi:hypothetical protein